MSQDVLKKVLDTDFILNIGSKKIVIKKFIVKQIPSISVIGACIFDVFSRMDSKEEFNFSDFLPAIMDDHFDSLVKLIAISCSMTSEEVEEFDLESFSEISLKMFEINSSFFLEKLPALMAKAKKKKAKKK